MVWEWLQHYYGVALSVGLAIGWFFTRNDGKTLNLVGRVLWPGDTLLPPHVRYRVSLVDLTTKGAPAVVASTTQSLQDNGAAMPFGLTLAEKTIEPGRTYGFWAELIAGDKVIYNSGIASLADLSQSVAISLPLRLAAELAIVPPPSLHNILPEGVAGTQWRVLAAGGIPSATGSDDSLHIASNGTLSGVAAGHAYFAEARFEGDTMQVLDLGIAGFATELLPQAQQRRLVDSLLATRRYVLEAQNLSLLDAEGKRVLTLGPLHSATEGTVH